MSAITTHRARSGWAAIAQNENAPVSNDLTEARGNVRRDTCDYTRTHDPLAGWLALGKPSRATRQPKRQRAK